MWKRGTAIDTYLSKQVLLGYITDEVFRRLSRGDGFVHERLEEQTCTMIPILLVVTERHQPRQ